MKSSQQKFMIRPPEPVQLRLHNNCKESHPDCCSICLDDLVGPHHKFVACGHCFHLACISKWAVDDHTNCPRCRAHVKIPIKTIKWHRNGKPIKVLQIKR